MNQLAGKTILVVDDEPDLREVITDELKYEGAKVLEATSGREAFTLLESQAVDGVVSDILMAGGNGIELLDRIRAIRPEKPVVVLISGYTEVSTEDAYDKGAEAVFMKPFEITQLVQSMRSLLNPARLRWTETEKPAPGSASLTMKIQDLKSAAQARILNIGRGGLFAIAETVTPRVGQLVSFQIDSPGFELRGNGICRWFRPRSADGHPPGFGLEFRELSPKSIDALEAFLKDHQTRSFIPKN